MTEDQYLSIQQTCERLDRTRWTVHRLIKAGTLRARKIGPARNAEVQVAKDSVDAYLAGRPVEANADIKAKNVDLPPRRELSVADAIRANA
ncbi:hypothetical protein GCM10010176_034950 [Nonomuraea spiralis]|nr:hypothetical protein GCM10010176_034950 [Nonomuraea spiralis]